MFRTVCLGEGLWWTKNVRYPVEKKCSIMNCMNIVLYEPDIPWNTGNIGRTCVATGSVLHLVGRLGFSMDAKEIRRSGLDYWEKLQLVRYPDWEAFLAATPAYASLFLFSRWAEKELWNAPFQLDSYLVFGCETSGLPEHIRHRHRDRLYRIPMEEGSVRSLNLSTAVSIALYEALRQTRSRSGAPVPLFSSAPVEDV